MLEALNRYIDNGNGNGGVSPEIIWGPNCGADEIADTIIMASCFLLTAAVALNEIANVADVGGAFGVHYEVYKGLIAAKSADEST
jgi:hypothetical protein